MSAVDRKSKHPLKKIMNECLIFYPNMKCGKQVLERLAPTSRPIELIESLYEQIEQPRLPVE